MAVCEGLLMASSRQVIETHEFTLQSLRDRQLSALALGGRLRASSRFDHQQARRAAAKGEAIGLVLSGQPAF